MKRWITFAFLTALVLAGSWLLFGYVDMVDAASSVICDNSNTNCFSKYQSAGAWATWPWPTTEPAYGAYNGQANWTYNTYNTGIDWGKWQPSLPQSGDYDVYVWYPHLAFGSPDTTSAHYQIHGSDGDVYKTWNQSVNGVQWNYLATVHCTAGTQCFVKLTDESHESTGTHRVWFDAIKFVLKSTPTPTPTSTSTSTPTPTSTPVPTATPNVGDTILVESRNVEYFYNGNRYSSPLSCSTSAWYEWKYGGGGHGVITLNASTSSQSTNYARWRPNLPHTGWYKVETYIPYHPSFQWPCGNYRISWDTSKAKYEIHHANGTSSRIVNQAPLSNKWVDLGHYYMNAGTVGYVQLGDLTGEPFASRWISFDDMRFTYLGNEAQPTGSVGGKITNDQTDQPIPRVAVAIAGKKVATGSDGRYVVNNIVPGTYTIQVSKDGYNSASGTVTITGNASTVWDKALTPVRTGGLYTFPLVLSPSKVKVSSWFDTYFDQKDHDLKLISEYNGIEGYNSNTVVNRGAGYCWKEGSVYFYPGQVNDYGPYGAYWYNCRNWSSERAYNRHDGTDYAVGYGNWVIAAAPGTVNYKSSDTIILTHSDNSKTAYVHVTDIGRHDSSGHKISPLYKGSKVSRGDIIAKVNGSHLHFGVKLNAEGKNWWDANPSNHAPTVDPYTNRLWASDSGVMSTNLSGNSVMPMVYAQENPEASFTASPWYAIGENTQIAFDASASTSSNGAIVQCIWDFGDGSEGSGIQTTHVYTTPGTYYVSAAVYDEQDAVAYAGPYPVVIRGDVALTELDGTRHTSIINTGQVWEQTILVPDTLRARFYAEWSTGEVQISLVAPDGTVINSETSLANVHYESGDDYGAYRIDNPRVGAYTIRIEGTTIPDEGIPVTLYAQVIDVHPPIDGSVSMETIPTGPGSTLVRLNLAIGDQESIADMSVRYAIDQGIWSDWQAFSSVIESTIDSEIVESAVVQFRDSAGNLSPLFGAGILSASTPTKHQVFLPIVIK